METIKFNAEMIQAIIDGRKTQTRRPVKPQPDSRHCSVDYEYDELKESSLLQGCWHVNRKWVCPYGTIGEKRRIEGTDVIIQIERIRVEEFEDISAEDVLFEAVPKVSNDEDPFVAHFENFEKCWDTIYGETEYRSEKNPWVWVIDFKSIPSPAATEAEK